MQTLKKTVFTHNNLSCQYKKKIQTIGEYSKKKPKPILMRKTRNEILIYNKLDFGKISGWKLDHQFLDLKPKRNFSRAL